MPDLAAAAKFEMLQDVLALARQQHAALEHDDFDHFDALLEERESLLQRLEALDARGTMPSNVVPFPIPAHVAADDAVAVDAMIRGILDQDRRNEALLAARMNEIRKELPALAAGQRAANAYRVAPAPGMAFIDRVS